MSREDGSKGYIQDGEKSIGSDKVEPGHEHRSMEHDRSQQSLEANEGKASVGERITDIALGVQHTEAQSTSTQARTTQLESAEAYEEEPSESPTSTHEKQQHAEQTNGSASSGKEQLPEDPEKNAAPLQQTPSAPIYSAFSTREKVWIVFMSTLGAFISPLSTNIYFPALPALADYYNQSISHINLTLTTYMIFQAIAPMFFSDAADRMGHRPPMIIAYIIYFAANIGCATQTSYPALLVLRCLQSLGSSGTVAIRMAVIAAVITPAERGKYMSWAQVGVLMAPTLAPVLGGLLAEYLGWRSIFWFLVIVSGLYLIVYIVAMPETHRGLVGDGSVRAHRWYNRSVFDYWRKGRLMNTDHADIDHNKTKLRFPNPLKTLMLIREPDIAVVLTWSMFQYAAFYDLLTTIPSVYGERYHLNSLEQGLCYIPIGVGAAVAAICNGRIMDWSYRKTAIKYGLPTDRKRKQDIRNFPVEEARLRAVVPLMVPGLLTTICYGWALQYGPLAAPLVLQFILGASLTASFTAMSSMLIDLYPQGPATITACNNLTRCLFGAGATALVQPMIEGMGIGWTYTLIGALLALFVPLIFVELKLGPKFRAARYARQDAKEAAKKERERQESDAASSNNTSGEKKV